MNAANAVLPHFAAAHTSRVQGYRGRDWLLLDVGQDGTPRLRMHCIHSGVDTGVVSHIGTASAKRIDSLSTLVRLSLKTTSP